MIKETDERKQTTGKKWEQGDGRGQMLDQLFVGQRDLGQTQTTLGVYNSMFTPRRNERNSKIRSNNKHTVNKQFVCQTCGRRKYKKKLSNQQNRSLNKADVYLMRKIQEP